MLLLLENTSLISEHLKATDQERMLEEVINHSENIEHFMNKAGLKLNLTYKNDNQQMKQPLKHL